MKKGFTLIELLAVIVILAIIALIAIPIVMNIINNSKDSSYKRSVEAYGKAIEQAAVTYNINNNIDPKGKYLESNNGHTLTNKSDSSIVLTINYEGNKVQCEVIEIYEEGEIYLDGCKVSNSNKEYSYGVSKTPPGAYDAEDNLVATWDDLVNVYGLDIESDYESSTVNSSASSAKNVFKQDNLQNITKLVIPYGVTNIGDYAFYDCSNLITVEIPNSVTRIGYAAFQNCSNLTTIEIPDSVTYLGGYAFYNCTNLTYVVLSKNIENPGTAAFQFCGSLKEVIIPEGIEFISSGMFTGCSSLRSITLPSTIEHIDQYAFSNCSSLEEIDIPNGVKTIPYQAFEGCTNLTSIEIPPSVTSIASNAFSRCTNLSYITVDSGNKVYEDRNSNSIIEKKTNKIIVGSNNTIIPSSVTSIESNAFTGRVIESIEIPSSITNIGFAAFLDCHNLSSIEVDEGNAIYEDGDSNSIIEKSTNKLIVGSNNTVIPNVVTVIGKFAFTGRGIESIEIPDSVNTIEQSAFYGCTNLTSVTISSSVTSIERSAFSGCNNLESAIFENQTGWWFSTSSTATSGTDIPTGYCFASTSSAARCLVNDYVSKYWKRS